MSDRDDEFGLDAELDDESGNDERVGVWFRRSFLAVAGLAAVITLAWWLAAPEPAEEVMAPDAQAPQVMAQPDPPAFRFVEEAAARGLAFHFENGAYGARYLPETMVGGVAFFDYDADGDPDVLLTAGNRWPFDETQPALTQTIGLFENIEGRFVRRDQDLGLVTEAYVMGTAIGDYDGDGDPDIYLTNLGPNQLFENRGPDGFQEVALAAGAAGAEEWSTGATFFDANGDQWPDLLVVNYVTWSPENDEQANYQIAGLGRAYGPPTDFPGSLPRLYLNDGAGRLVDQSSVSGLRDVPADSAKSLAVLARDLDEDGDTDLFIANDTTRNFLFLNNGEGRFAEDGQGRGVAFDNTGKSTGAMGVDLGYVLNDTSLSLAVGNFANEMTSFYSSQRGQAQFADDALLVGVGPASRLALTFGLFFADLDLDGRQDLFQANGHVENLINRVQPSQTYRQSPQLFWNCGEACERAMVPVAPPNTANLTDPLVARGAAAADVDGDGDLDILMAEVGGAPRLLINETAGGPHWIKVRLIGQAPNTEGLGARLTVTSGAVTQQREVSRTRSYLSQFDLNWVFGLPEPSASIRVRWPDGSLSVAEAAAGERLEVRQPAP